MEYNNKLERLRHNVVSVPAYILSIADDKLSAFVEIYDVFCQTEVFVPMRTPAIESWSDHEKVRLMQEAITNGHIGPYTASGKRTIGRIMDKPDED